LRESGSAFILCDDVEGIDWVRLKEFQIFRGGTHKKIEIRKAEDDIFASLEERDRSIPNGGRLSKASFQIKLSDSKTPRTVTLSSGNQTHSSNGMMTPKFWKNG
jgi:oligoribonuclease NrnB/cAMP/cGMP phosphodiesterase (DHH superfamily)